MYVRSRNQVRGLASTPNLVKTKGSFLHVLTRNVSPPGPALTRGSGSQHPRPEACAQPSRVLGSGGSAPLTIGLWTATPGSWGSGGSAPLTRGLYTATPGAGGAGLSTPAGPPPPKDITVTRGLRQLGLGAVPRTPGPRTAAHPQVTEGPGARPTWKTKKPRLTAQGCANSL